jgi:HD-GYP domain-containing protein (c-di-GMP phosphodiesterase class II)
MTSERPYKPPMTVDDAVAECERCSGTHFAPEVVAALQSVMRHGLRAAA